MSALPSDGTLSAEKLCAITGLTDRRHRQLAQAGYFPAPIKGRYQGGPTLVGLLRYFKERADKKDDTLAQEQTAYLQAKRMLAQEELAQFRGQYVRVAELGPALRNVSLHQRAVLQRRLEQELAPNLVGKTTLEILSLVRSAVDDICAIFREGTKQWTKSPPESQT